MNAQFSQTKSPRSCSISKRFTYALIGVVTLFLTAFAASAIFVNTRRIDVELENRLDQVAEVARAGLAVPLWDHDDQAVNRFAEALLLDDALAFMTIKSDGQIITKRTRSGFEGKDFFYFDQSPNFRLKAVDIRFKNKTIGTFQVAVSRENVKKELILNIAGIVTLTILLIAAIALTSVLISRRYISGPLLRLQGSAAAIAGGDLEAAIDTTGADEIGTLARSFNSMRGSIKHLIQALRESNEKLAQANRTLEQRVDERTAELSEALNRLHALNEVGRAVSSTLDLQAVLTNIVAHAVQLTGTDAGAIFEYDEQTEQFFLRATHHAGSERIEEDVIAALRAKPMRLGEGALGRASATRQPFQIPDVLRTSVHDDRLHHIMAQSNLQGSVLAVPLLREGRILGGIVVRRSSPGEFASEVVELLQTFAGQSVLAMQNARLFQELKEKSQQLESANQHKSQFLANMSHELRTPLNAILGYSEMLQEEAEDLGQDNCIPDLQRIHGAGRHLLALINNILDLSKIEAGKIDLFVENFGIRAMIQEVMSTISPLAEKNGNMLEVECTDDVGAMRADLTKVRQILFNILSNACKFTHRGKIMLTITRKMKNGSERVNFCVRDTGIGMRPEQVEKVFEAFTQADASTTRKYGGTGLGLAISREFCQLMGGNIDVESEPGQGSTFTISLPAEVADAEATAAPCSTENSEVTPRPLKSAHLGLGIDNDPRFTI